METALTNKEWVYLGQYASVQWEAGDEVTSTKLNQMAENDDWLKDNMLTGEMRVPIGTLGQVAIGRTRGVTQAKKLTIVTRWIDSQTPVKEIDLGFAIPPGFSQSPICLAGLDMPFSNTAIRILQQVGTKEITFSVGVKVGAASAYIV